MCGRQRACPTAPPLCRPRCSTPCGRARDGSGYGSGTSEAFSAAEPTRNPLRPCRCVRSGGLIGRRLRCTRRDEAIRLRRGGIDLRVSHAHDREPRETHARGGMAQAPTNRLPPSNQPSPRPTNIRRRPEPRGRPRAIRPRTRNPPPPRRVRPTRLMSHSGGTRSSSCSLGARPLCNLRGTALPSRLLRCGGGCHFPPFPRWRSLAVSHPPVRQVRVRGPQPPRTSAGRPIEP